MERKLVYPAIYKHFKNKYYATMGIVKPMNNDDFWDLSRRPNIIYFHAECTETNYEVPIIRHKGEFYSTDVYLSENCALYKSLYDGHIPYIRPLDMFLSEVDKEKYPNVSQQYRFELVRY